MTWILNPPDDPSECAATPKRNAKGTQQWTFTLPIDLLNRLKACAAEEHTPVAHQAREAIRLYLDTKRW